MDKTTRDSVGDFLPDTEMESAIIVLDSHWTSPFWALNSIQFDPVVSNQEFDNFLDLYGISARPNKNVLESKH